MNQTVKRMKIKKENLKMDLNKQSIIVRIVSNRYHVFHQGEIVHAIAMGKLRLGNKPIVGDEVRVEWIDPNYVIQELYPRRNALTRPLVANVDQTFVVMSATEPEFSYTLVDRLIFLISLEGIEPIIVLTKKDLVSPEFVDEVRKEYEGHGYQFIATGLEDNVEALESMLDGKISVLSGQSGVGKSSILNRINEDFSLQTQEISKALGRGKHTTRHNQLYNLAGGWVADTPGFSSLDFSTINPKALADAIPDFKPYHDQCRYRDCLHVSEPSCKIKEEVELGNISKIRYANYLDCLELIKEEKR